MAATPEQIVAAKDAWFMGAERAQRPPTAQDRLDAKISASWDRNARMERWLFSKAPLWRMPAGNACGFAVEAATWLRRNHPEITMDDPFRDAFLYAINAYRNERLLLLGEHQREFCTRGWR